MTEPKLKLTNRGWNVVTVLGVVAFICVMILAGWMEAAL